MELEYDCVSCDFLANRLYELECSVISLENENERLRVLLLEHDITNWSVEL